MWGFCGGFILVVVSGRGVSGVSFVVLLFVFGGFEGYGIVKLILFTI